MTNASISERENNNQPKLLKGLFSSIVVSVEPISRHRFHFHPSFFVSVSFPPKKQKGQAKAKPKNDFKNFRLRWLVSECVKRERESVREERVGV